MHKEGLKAFPRKSGIIKGVHPLFLFNSVLDVLARAIRSEGDKGYIDRKGRICIFSTAHEGKSFY